MIALIIALVLAAFNNGVGFVTASERAVRNPHSTSTQPPTNPPPAPGDCTGAAPKRGNTRGGLMGFAHGYRWGQLNAADRSRYVNEFVATGSKWWRLFMASYNNTQFDNLIALLPADICIVGEISNNPGGPNWSDPPDHQVWADRAAGLVSRYKNRIHVWEIWNEPNLGGFWATRSKSAYYDLLHTTYVAIKKVDPTATVLGAGLAPQGGSSDPYNAVNWWRDAYTWNASQNRSGSDQLFDGLAHHPYLYPNDPTDPANFKDWSGFYQTKLIHDLMASKGDAHKRVWGTEGGAPTECSLSECVHDMASRIPRMMNIWQNDWGSFTGPFMFHQLQDQPDQPTSSHEHWMGIIRTDWNRKGHWSAFRDYATS